MSVFGSLGGVTAAQLQAAVPQPATTAPPAVADASAAGVAAPYARADHTHLSSVQGQRVAFNFVNGVATWVFPIPYAAGIVPVVETTVETPEGAAYEYDAKIIAGSVTNTQCKVSLSRREISTTLPALATALLGLVIPMFTRPTVSAVVHCWARKPTA